MNKCKNCQQPTKNPKFCSRSCAASFTNKEQPKRKLTRKCSACDCDNTVMNYRSSFCQLHQSLTIASKKEKILNTALGEYRNRIKKNGLHASSADAAIRNFARSWFKELTQKPCACCGYEKHVELCHIKPLSEFSDKCLIKEANHKDNIIQLCPNCHWELDNGYDIEW